MEGWRELWGEHCEHCGRPTLMCEDDLCHQWRTWYARHGIIVDPDLAAVEEVDLYIRGAELQFSGQEAQ